MQAKTKLPVIHRSEKNPPSGDYQYLYEQGLQWISEYSGDNWNNYNLGDPGVTILQTLCYALTELSYKTSLPIEDILTKENGKINYKNRFVKPQDILPSSPVSLVDFKKKLIDEVAELKQVYFNLKNRETTNIFIPFLELQPAFKKVTTSERDNIQSKVDQVLLDYQNVGQLFQPSVILTQNLLKLKGQINVDASINLEEFIASLIFALNNYLSPYPLFYTYEDLLNDRKSNDEIFDGPLLNGGFLADDNFQSKRKFITLHNLMVTINNVEGVSFVSDLNFDIPISDEFNFIDFEKIDVSDSEVFYFSIESLFHDKLEIIQNGRSVDSISEHKVEYQLTKLIPQPHRPTNFDEYLPTGTFREIGEYYSIQHHFPEIYELNKKYKSQNTNPTRIAKNKQLKAYLGLYEQILANYLAQLDHVGDLFSFDSGRNKYQLAGKTYYFQDIYEVPGIQEILRDVSGYNRKPSVKNEAEDWKAYKRDSLNPYRQELMAAIESPEANLARKNKVLKHLLARFGAEHNANYLNLTNPNYGDAQTAEVVQISDTLKTFPLLSANRARSYFQKGEANNTLFAGLELIADNQLQLNGYYEGIMESIYQIFENDSNLIEAIYCKPKDKNKVFGIDRIERPNPIKGDWIELHFNKKLLFKFSNKEIFFNQLIDEAGRPMNRELFIPKLKKLLSPTLFTLERLIQQSKGFIFIDNIRLFQNFTFNLEVKCDVAYYFQNLQIDQLQNFVAFIRNGLDLNFEDLANSNNQLYKIWISAFQFKESSAAKNAFEQTKSILNTIPVEFTVTVNHPKNLDNNEDHPINLPMEIPLHFIDNSVSIIIPEWIALLQKTQYKQFFINKLREILPMNVVYKIYDVRQTTMSDLLTFYNCWMGEILAAKKQNEFRCLREFEQEEIWNILNILKNLKSNYES
ncbi:MAG: hypothetical protein AB8H03_11120 [Saprospiraceae bacterium]